MGFCNQCRHISGTCPPQIHNIVGIAFGDLRFSMDLSLEASLFDEFARFITRRVFEDCSCMSLWWLYLFAVLLMFSDKSAQLLRVFTMQMDTQQHDDFSRFDSATRCRDELSLQAKMRLSLCAETAIAIAQ